MGLAPVPSRMAATDALGFHSSFFFFLADAEADADADAHAAEADAVAEVAEPVLDLNGAAAAIAAVASCDVAVVVEVIVE